MIVVDLLVILFSSLKVLKLSNFGLHCPSLSTFEKVFFEFGHPCKTIVAANAVKYLDFRSVWHDYSSRILTDEELILKID